MKALTWTLVTIVWFVATIYMMWRTVYIDPNGNSIYFAIGFGIAAFFSACTMAWYWFKETKKDDN